MQRYQFERIYSVMGKEFGKIKKGKKKNVKSWLVCLKGLFVK